MPNLKHVLPMLTFMILLAMLLAFTSLQRSAANPTAAVAEVNKMTVVNHLGENYIISSVAIQNDYAYVSADPDLGDEPGLAVLNISNPTTPEQIAFLALPTQPDEVFVAGNYAFARTNNEIRIVDISVPFTLREVGEVTGEKVEAVEGNYVYVGESEGMLRVWDISDPTSPVNVGSYAYGGRDIEVANSHLYVLENTGVRIVNLADPTTPTEVAFFETEGTQVAIKDHYLLISWGNCQYESVGPFSTRCTSCEGGIKVVDISTPDNPLPVYDTQHQGLITGMSVEGNYALLNTYDCWAAAHRELEWVMLEAVDISDPTTPRESQIVRSRRPNDVAARGNYVYLADDTKGMQIWNVSAENVGHASSYGTQAPIYDIATADGYAYLVGSQYKLQVVDLFNYSQPTPVATLEGNARKVMVVDNYAYVLKSSGLHIVDISNPTAPIEVAVYEDGEGDVAIVNDIAIMGDSISLGLVDISTPTNPTLIGSTDAVRFDSEIRGIAVSGNYAYLTWEDCPGVSNNVCGDEGGLSIVDISTPSQPILVGIYEDLAVDPGIDLKGDYAYVGNSGSMNVVDVSQPITPTIVASHPIPGTIESLTIRGDHAYLATESGRVAIFNISNPTSPEMISFYDMPEHPWGIDVSDGYIYVADDNWGLITLQYASRIAGRVSQANGLPFPVPDVAISSSVGLTTTTNTEGHYVFGEQLTGTYTISPAHSDYSFWPATQIVSVPSDAEANFTILPAPVSTTLTAGISTTLTVTDTQRAPTHFDFPTNAVTSSTTIFLTPTVATNQTGYAFTGHAFELDATPQSTPTFNAPVTITIHYTDADSGLISDTNQLALWKKQDDGWQDAAQTCNPASDYDHNHDAQTITVAICQTGQFALFGPTNNVFLPLITAHSNRK